MSQWAVESETKYIFSCNIKKLYRKAFFSPVSFFRLFQKANSEDALMFFFLVSLINIVALCCGMMLFNVGYSIFSDTYFYDDVILSFFGLE